MDHYEFKTTKLLKNKTKNTCGIQGKEFLDFTPNVQFKKEKLTDLLKFKTFALQKTMLRR